MKRKPREFEEKEETIWGQEDIQEETLGSHSRSGGTLRNKEGTSQWQDGRGAKAEGRDKREILKKRMDKRGAEMLKQNYSPRAGREPQAGKKQRAHQAGTRR